MTEKVAATTPLLTESDLMWVDPDSNVQGGMLLSDRIEFYVERVKLIDPFDNGFLGPASYALTLGSVYWLAEDSKTHASTKTLLNHGDPLRIPPNSIVFVSSAETLNLPFYIAGRFNLKLKLIYEGLLVGAGPQVDPGFRGRLSCPLHNISDQAVFLNAGETFAIIDFQKTTPFSEQERWSGKATYSEVRRRGETYLLKGKNGLPCLTFPVAKLDREPVKGYLPFGKLVSSSVAGLEERVTTNQTKIDDGLKKLEDAVSRINLISFITVVVVAVSLGTYFFGAVNWARGVRDDANKVVEGQSNLQKDTHALENRIRDLEVMVKQLQTTNQDNKQSNSKNTKKLMKGVDGTDESD